jgi:hypothetical protein
MKIQELLKNEMIEGIESVLSGKQKRFKSSNIPPIMVQEYLESKGYEMGVIDTNGWDYDWWLPFTKDGKSFTAFGSGYYGRFEFYPTEEP